MKKYALALLVAALAVTGAHASTEHLGVVDTSRSIVLTNDALYDSSTFAPAKRQDRLAQNVVSKDTTRVETSAPVTSTTTVRGGDLAASLIEWLKVAFGTTIGAAALWAISRVLSLMGIKTTDLQRAQLQSIVVNGLNAAAAKAQVSLRSTDKLDFSSKSQIVNDAVSYAQDHASETIRALGLDPKSGDAVQAIKARIETALNDPATPTPPAITPPSGMPNQPLAPSA